MNIICKTCYTKFQTSRKVNYRKNKKLKLSIQEQHVNVIQPFNDLLSESQGHVDSNKDNLQQNYKVGKKQKYSSVNKDKLSESRQKRRKKKLINNLRSQVGGDQIFNANPSYKSPPQKMISTS